MKNTLDNLLESIAEYYIEEFKKDEKTKKEIINKLKEKKIIDLAYTEDDDGAGLQVNLDIINNKLLFYKNNNLELEKQFKNIEELYNNLELNFWSLIYFCNGRFNE